MTQKIGLPLQQQNMRKVGIWEGISYIVLLFIAMPLKYFGDLPLAVRWVGTIHGVLFLLFIYTIVRAVQKTDLSIKNGFVAFIASLIPFGTFFLDRLVFKK